MIPDAVEPMPPPQSFSLPYDLEAQEAALSQFQDLMKTSSNPQDFESWTTVSTVRQNVFANLVMGRIRWPKSLGRPATSQLFGGFIIDRVFWADIWHIGLDGNIVTDENGWTPGSAPSVWDGPAEEDHYSVVYLFDAADQSDNQVNIRFSEVHWQHPAHSSHRNPHRYLSSQGWQFYSAGQFTALPIITVDNQPFLHL
jgi:hypothetical protein